MKKILTEKKLRYYCPGKECKCCAVDSISCSCKSADWTPKEVYQLRLALKEILKIANTFRYMEHMYGDIKKIEEIAEKSLE